MQSIQEQVGEEIRKLRRAKDMTQRELAKRSKISNVWLCNIEKGKANARLATLTKIFTALDVTMVLSMNPVRS